MRDLVVDNFRLGQRRDGALQDDKLYSMRTLLNFIMLYTDGRLEVRPGYERWNDSGLPDIVEQLYIWLDMDENENFFAILEAPTSRWYIAQEVGAHLPLINEAVTRPAPVVPMSNRVMFATDSNAYWTDNATIAAGPPRENRLGILPPGDGLQVDAVAAQGHTDTPIPGMKIDMNPTTARRLAIQYDVGASDERASAIYISVQRWLVGTLSSGTWRVKCYTDAGGSPSATLVDPDAVSEQIKVTNFNAGSYQYKRFRFNAPYTLPASTTVWFVVEGDENYYNNWLEVAGPNDFYAGIGFEGTVGMWDYGPMLTYDIGTALWSASPYEAVFYLSGVDSTLAYGYVITFYNSTYAIESRPSDEFRSEIATTERFLISNYPAPTDPQVDLIRVYRREMTNVDDPEDSITDEYKFVGEFVNGAILYDSLGTWDLGALLQTENHYALDETDENEDGYRPVVVVPYAADVWKGRLWVCAEDDNVIWFSKKLEEIGATGIIGDSIFDYFPFENRLDIPVPSSVIGIHALSEDQLVIYYRNEEVWLVWGCDEVLNPPADIAIRQALATHGLTPVAGMAQMMNSHVYLSSSGLQPFAGSQAPIFGVSSETNQSILDEISGANLRESVVATFGNEIWCLIDMDDDGDLDTILILDLERITTGTDVIGSAWRMHRYDVTLNDLAVRQTAAESKTIFAADAENAYILKLNTGTTDNGNPIAWELETHDLRAKNMAAISKFEMDARYPGTPPTITVTLTSHDGDTAQFTLTPSSSNDIRGHRKGLRLKAPVSVRLKLEGSSIEADQVLSILARYLGE